MLEHYTNPTKPPNYTTGDLALMMMNCNELMLTIIIQTTFTHIKWADREILAWLVQGVTLLCSVIKPKLKATKHPTLELKGYKLIYMLTIDKTRMGHYDGSPGIMIISQTGFLEKGKFTVE